jgi:hypothetical protein
MKSSRRRVGVSIAFAVTGAITGWLGVTAAMPLIRQVDPLGLSPVILMCVTGGVALGWYLRGRAEPSVASAAARVQPIED